MKSQLFIKETVENEKDDNYPVAPFDNIFVRVWKYRGAR